MLSCLAMFVACADKKRFGKSKQSPGAEKARQEAKANQSDAAKKCKAKGKSLPLIGSGECIVCDSATHKKDNGQGQCVCGEGYNPSKDKKSCVQNSSSSKKVSEKSSTSKTDEMLKQTNQATQTVSNSGRSQNELKQEAGKRLQPEQMPQSKEGPLEIKKASKETLQQLEKVAANSSGNELLILGLDIEQEQSPIQLNSDYEIFSLRLMLVAKYKEEVVSVLKDPFVVNQLSTSQGWVKAENKSEESIGVEVACLESQLMKCQKLAIMVSVEDHKTVVTIENNMTNVRQLLENLEESTQLIPSTSEALQKIEQEKGDSESIKENEGSENEKNNEVVTQESPSEETKEAVESK